MSDSEPADTLDTNLVAPPFVSPLPSAKDAIPALDPRGYEPLEPLGKGGMGEVFRCVDPALGRDLAIKVMAANLRGLPLHEQRFLREARITGSLQHPGIVPVHNLGRLPDGRLHYTMRLVRGRTLAAILKEEAGKEERFPSLLLIFEKICQAVAYAHSKRVIHRDLKPANVMVGKFGEVQVMDWGLAKLLGERGCVSAPSVTDPTGTVIYTEADDSPSDLTRAGSGLGTPAYLSPEQALGEWDAVDERADVFALGCILCEMLTGHPPYRGRDGNELLRHARRGELTEALTRLAQCPADEALKRLCRDCLTTDAEKRPRHAGVTAQGISDYLADVQERLRQAQLERVAAETRATEEQARAELETKRAKAERRAKRQLLALSLAIGALLCLAIGGGWWIAREKAERAEEAVARLQADARANEARGHYLRAEVYYGKGQWNEAIAEYRKSLELQPDAVEYWIVLAEVFYETQRWDEAIATYEQVIRLKPDYPVVQNNLGDALLKKGLTDRAIQAYREAVRLDPDYVAAHYNLASCLYNKDRWNEALPEYREAIRLDPKTASYHTELGLTLWKLGRVREALPTCREAVRLKPDYADGYNVLGIVLDNLGEFQAAVDAYRADLRLAPDHAVAHTNLGLTLGKMGRPEEAIAEHRTAIRIKPDLALAHDNLATILLTRGSYTEAKESWRTALRLAPGNSTYQKNVDKCDKYLALERQLPAIVQGQPLPSDAQDAVRWACLCYHKKHYAAAARIYAAALAADAKLAADRGRDHRYNAACQAVLAAAGQGVDARALPDKVAAMFRRWALRWLRDDLTAYAQTLDGKDAAAIGTVRIWLSCWRYDPDLASVRDPQALARLPGPERAAWHALWREVDVLAKQLTK